MSGSIQALDELTSLGIFSAKEVISLASANIYSVVDLLNYAPRRYEDRRRFDRFPTQASQIAVCLRGQVVDAGKRFFGRSKGGVYEVVIQASNEVGFSENSITCRWFNAPYVSKIIAVGMELTLYGKAKNVSGKLVIDHPEFEVVNAGGFGGDGSESVHIERIVPVYKAISGIAQRRLRSMVYELLNTFDFDSIQTIISVDESYPRAEAYRELHFPSEMQQAEAARRFFALEEFVSLQLEVRRRRMNYQKQDGRSLGKKTDLLKLFYEQLPFDFTGAQKRCVKEILHDMRKLTPMNRMLQGDVGSGKTFVALCAALLAVDSGVQVAMMAPTQILAEQHFLTFKKWLEPLGVRIGLRTSDRIDEVNSEQSSQLQIIIGTHALLYDDDLFQKLGLVIIDEQHKFGVEQRSRLIRKGVMPDALVMTATPIPRTLTLTIYGDLDVSVIDEYPSGRGSIVTGVRENAKLTDVTKFLKEKLAEGRQVYIVYPLVENSENLKAESAIESHAKWQKRLNNYEVGLVHGKLKSDLKEEVMQSFRANEIQVLVSTSVIEVGVDVPNASVMIIYNAERFGLSQLHQLRGRVGRGEHKSYCVLMTKSKQPEALEKLSVIAGTRDGFKISEADLRMRGPGDVLGTEQSGLSEIRFIEYLADVELIREARKIADAIIAEESSENDH